MSILSPLGFEYYFFADYEDPFGSIIYEALEFDELEYCKCLMKKNVKDNLKHSHSQLSKDATWIKEQLVNVSKTLLTLRSAVLHLKGC